MRLSKQSVQLSRAFCKGTVCCNVVAADSHIRYAVQGYFSHAAAVPPSANQHAASDICRDTGQGLLVSLPFYQLQQQLIELRVPNNCNYCGTCDDIVAAVAL